MPLSIQAKAWSNASSGAERFAEHGFRICHSSIDCRCQHQYIVRLAKKDKVDYEVPLMLGSIMVHEIGHSSWALVIRARECRQRGPGNR
jgi:hypothetical protein